MLDMLWSPYLLRNGAGVIDFWKDYLAARDRHLLYVLGRGFDRRMCRGISQILDLGCNGKRDCLLIGFDEGDSSPSNAHAKEAEANEDQLRTLLGSRGNLMCKDVAMWESDGQAKWRVGSRKAADALTASDLRSYTDVVVDVSAMPRSIYLPIIAKALHLLGFGRRATSASLTCNLHVIVAENAELDGQIRDENPDVTANYIHGFGALDTQTKAGSPMIWMPILGERQNVQLERIYTKVNPSEICPIVPAVSRDPRRGDKLLIDEYHDILFERWRIEPENIIYAAERNPFEAYRQIRQAAIRYGRALAPIGGCRVVLSAVSNKLLSIGALLAAYELHLSTGNKESGVVGVGIAHVEASGYIISDTSIVGSLDADTDLFGLWLAGDCYA